MPIIKHAVQYRRVAYGRSSLCFQYVDQFSKASFPNAKNIEFQGREARAIITKNKWNRSCNAWLPDFNNEAPGGIRAREEEEHMFIYRSVK